MLLSEFAGNDEVKTELSEAMKNNTLPHALIIDGAKGTGKKTLARIIAQYSVCSSEENRPCGVCPHCLKAEKNIHPDIMTSDGNNSGGLNVEAIRNIRSSAYIKPNEARAKVYMLFNCEKMLAAAQNAFLKILEEPPENVMFIMTAISAASLLQTVRSRSRTLSLYPVDVLEAQETVRKLVPDKSDEEIISSVRACGGNIGAALEMLESGGEEAMLLAQEIFRAIPLSTEYKLLTLTNRAVQNRASAIQVLDRMSELSAECVKASVGAENVSEAAVELAKKMSRRRIMKIQETVSHARSVLDVNVNLNFYGTWLCSVLRNY